MMIKAIKFEKPWDVACGKGNAGAEKGGSPYTGKISGDMWF